MKGLKSNVKKGISGKKEDIDERKEVYGRNDPPVRNPTSIFAMIAECFEDLML